MLPDFPAPALIERRLTADRRTAAELATRWYRHRITRPLYLITVVLLLAVSFLVAVPLDGPTWTSSLPIMVVLTLGYATYRNARQIFGTTFPPGSVSTTAFGEDHLAMSGPTGASVLRYDAITAVEMLHGLVAVSWGSGRPTLMIPAELFPSEAVELVRRRPGPAPR